MPSPATPRPAVPDILEEHLEELAYAGIRLRALIRSHEVPERRLPALRSRRDAHREGLVLGGEASLALAAGILDGGDDPWLIAAAAWTWLAIARPAPTALASRVQDLDPALLPGWRQALRESDAALLQACAAEAMREDRPLAFRHLVLDALAWQGRTDAAALRRLAQDGEALLRWIPARHAGHALAAAEALPLLERLLGDPALAATAACGLLACEQARALRWAAAAPGSTALRILGLDPGEAPHPRLRAALADPELRACAIAALADHGSQAAAEILRSGGDEAAAALPRRVFPWQGKAADEPLACLWRRSLGAGGHWLRREIPDGWLGADADVAEAGT